MIGARFDEDNGHWSGSAYVFRLLPDPDVPATRIGGVVLLALTVLSTSVYFVRRRATG